MTNEIPVKVPAVLVDSDMTNERLTDSDTINERLTDSDTTNERLTESDTTNERLVDNNTTIEMLVDVPAGYQCDEARCFCSVNAEPHYYLSGHLFFLLKMVEVN